MYVYRKLPGIAWRNGGMRGHMERAAINTPIQVDRYTCIFGNLVFNIYVYVVVYVMYTASCLESLGATAECEDTWSVPPSTRPSRWLDIQIYSLI